MPKRKPVEATEPVPAIAEPAKKTTRKAAAPKAPAPASKAAHKHHAKKAVEPAVVETVTADMPVAVNTVVSHEAIARLAYSYWEARGYQGGSPEQDWLQAEQELLKLA